MSRQRVVTYPSGVDAPLLFKAMFRGQVPLDGYAKVTWVLPTKGSPGPWMPDVSPLVPFKSGYHLHGPGALLNSHLIGARVWVAEARGASLDRGPGRDFGVHESARLVRELDWSFRTRLRVALATARDAITYAGNVESCLTQALDEAEALATPAPEALREIEARVLRPTFPKGFSHWEEELENDPVGERQRRAAFNRYMTVSWGLAAEPSSTLMYGRGAVGGSAWARRIEEAYGQRVWAALFRGEVPPGVW